MERLLRTIPGSVSALELMFDTQALVRLVIDRDLLKDRYLSGHPGISTSTLCLEREEMIRFVEATGHTPTYLDLPDPRLSEQGGGLVTKS
jgi:Ala-tRNA(Pro) deacylase